MTAQNRKKSSILINPKFQLTVIGYSAIVAGVVLLSIYILFQFGFHEFAQIGNQAGLPSENVYFQFIQMQEAAFNRLFIAIALLVGLILLVGGLLISHRVAGPIYRMQKELRDMLDSSSKDLKPIQFRKGDFFPELAATFNELVEAWKKKHE